MKAQNPKPLHPTQNPKPKTQNPFEGVYADKRVLITGHTGFKGSWLAIWLKMLGAEVIGYSLEPPSDPSNFEACGLKDMLTHIHGDVRDYKHLVSVFQKYQPEFVFHLAAQPLVRDSYKMPVETYETNVMGTVNLLEAIKESSGVRAVVNVTTDKCYENREWIWGYREIEALGGYDPYSSSKACSELVTSAYRNSYFNPDHYSYHGVALASARAGNVIGGGDWGKDRLIPDCIRAFLKGKSVEIRNPSAIRPWQHVLEPLYGYLLLAERLYTAGPAFAEAWNFGPPDTEVLTVEEVVKKIIRLWGRGEFTVSPAPPLPGSPSVPHEAHYLKLDCSKARSMLGWQTRWNLETAIDKVMEWTKAYQDGKNIKEVCVKQIEEYTS